MPRSLAAITQPIDGAPVLAQTPGIETARHGHTPGVVGNGDVA